LCEAVRFQSCEGELLNAYGRLRAILRDADAPCTIRLLFDTCAMARATSSPRRR
jgi:hypothetical protein